MREVHWLFIDTLRKLNIDVDIDDEKLEKLNAYYHMLAETNSYMNLTAIIDEKEVYVKHFADSLTILRKKLIYLINQKTLS